VFCGFVGGKSRKKSFNSKKQHPFFEDIFQKDLAFQENVVILQAENQSYVFQTLVR